MTESGKDKRRTTRMPSTETYRLNRVVADYESSSEQVRNSIEQRREKREAEEARRKKKRRSIACIIIAIAAILAIVVASLVLLHPADEQNNVTVPLNTVSSAEVVEESTAGSVENADTQVRETVPLLEQETQSTSQQEGQSAEESGK